MVTQTQKITNKNFWDDCSEKKLLYLVENYLSDTQEPERIKIREILRVKNARSILDVGCGPATELLGYRLEGMDIDYVGLDSSQRMLSIARKRDSFGKFVYGEAETNPFSDKSFDVVLMKHILEHLPSYEKAILEAKRIARKYVIINLFKKLTSRGKDEITKSESGYWDNLYDGDKFEEFIKRHFEGFELYTIGFGTHDQHGPNDVYDFDTIYVLLR